MSHFGVLKVGVEQQHALKCLHGHLYSTSKLKHSMKKYLILLERTRQGYLAFSPDLEGCTATGSTPEEAKQNIEQAIKAHLYWLAKDGLPIPPPRYRSSYIKVNA